MPISSHAILPYVIQTMEDVQPKRVLDIGIGNGVYGALIYNYAPILLSETPKIIGVEPWGPYRNPLWEVYDEIHTKPIQEFKTHHKFGLIIMADVIEHMTLNEGHKQLKRLQAMLSPGGVVIVSTPAVFTPQAAYQGNVYEEHKCLWTPEKFKGHGFKAVPQYKTLFGEQMLLFKFKKEEDQV